MQRQSNDQEEAKWTFFTSWFSKQSPSIVNSSKIIFATKDYIIIIQQLRVHEQAEKFNLKLAESLMKFT